jgi:hypothetical protein
MGREEAESSSSKRKEACRSCREGSSKRKEAGREEAESSSSKRKEACRSCREGSSKRKDACKN